MMIFIYSGWYIADEDVMQCKASATKDAPQNRSSSIFNLDVNTWTRDLDMKLLLFFTDAVVLYSSFLFFVAFLPSAVQYSSSSHLRVRYTISLQRLHCKYLFINILFTGYIILRESIWIYPYTYGNSFSNIYNKKIKKIQLKNVI